MVSIGHLVGYAAGTVDLVKIFGTTFGDTQFKQLTFISAAALIIAVGITSYSVEERILLSGRYHPLCPRHQIVLTLPGTRMLRRVLLQL
jgi:hypothetical protein